MEAKTAILSLDWGTSSFRLRLVDPTCFRVLAEEKEAAGIAATFSAWKTSGEKDRWPFYLQVIAHAIQKLEEKTGTGLKGLPLVISGMASSTVGMIDLPYKEAPFLASGADLLVHVIVATTEFPHDCSIISGVKTDSDVMRGEETLLAGCATGADTGEVLHIFPGTHSKHVMVKSGVALGFHTYMTGEFFALLSGKSVLSASVEAGAGLQEKSNRKSFSKGVRDSKNANLLHGCFQVRTNDLFHRLSRQENYYYLSGLLIGTELLYLENTGKKIRLAGNALFNEYYVAALEVLDAARDLYMLDADEALVRGQCSVWLSLEQDKQRK
jgi:2-dehydro-3-deoxygalactonokinase